MCATFLWTPICFSMLFLFILVLMLHCFKYYIIYKIIDTSVSSPFYLYFCKFSILFLTLSLLYRLSLVNDLVNSRTMLSVRLCVFAQSCLTLCDPMDYNPSGFSISKISEARLPERAAIYFSGGIFPTQGLTCTSCIGRQILYT